MPGSSYRDVLRNPRFLQLWNAQLLTQISQNAINFALIVLINSRTGSTLAGAVLVVLFSLPAIVMGPLPGLLVDRVGRWWVLWTVNLLRVLLVVGMGLALALEYGGGAHGSSGGLVALLYLFSIGISLTTRFYMPAEATAIPRLIGLSGLAYGLALFGITFVLAQALGLIVLGPMLYSFFGWPAIFYIGAGIFAVATFCTLLLPPRRLGIYHSAQEEAQEMDVAVSEAALRAGLSTGYERQSLPQLIKAGWQATVGDRPALIAVIRLSLSGVVIALVSAVTPNFVVQVLHQPPEDVSLVLAPAGIALIVGAVLAPRIARRIGPLPAAGLGVNGVALGVALLALNRPLGDAAHFPNGLIIALAVLEASLLGFALNLISIPCQTVIQERVLPDLRGQALAFQQTLQNLAAAPVLLIVGFLADTVGIAWALLVVAIGVVCAARVQLPVKPKPKPPAQIDVVTRTDTLVS